jgi:hypothetical protein
VAPGSPISTLQAVKIEETKKVNALKIQYNPQKINRLYSEKQILSGYAAWNMDVMAIFILYL